MDTCISVNFLETFFSSVLTRSTCIFFLQADDMTPGVIYLGHIPHGFYENQIQDFFSQFGTVNKVRLSRSKKVGD